MPSARNLRGSVLRYPGSHSTQTGCLNAHRFLPPGRSCDLSAHRKSPPVPAAWWESARQSRPHPDRLLPQRPVMSPPNAAAPVLPRRSVRVRLFPHGSHRSRSASCCAGRLSMGKDAERDLLFLCEANLTTISGNWAALTRTSPLRQPSACGMNMCRFPTALLARWSFRGMPGKYGDLNGRLRITSRYLGVCLKFRRAAEVGRRDLRRLFALLGVRFDLHVDQINKPPAWTSSGSDWALTICTGERAICGRTLGRNYYHCST